MSEQHVDDRIEGAAGWMAVHGGGSNTGLSVSAVLLVDERYAHGANDARAGERVVCGNKYDIQMNVRPPPKSIFTLKAKSQK